MALVTPKHPRAEPLPPDDRRQAIVEAVIPLLLTKGATVTTREMAKAAAIAEGTIFRVFPDKASVIHEAVKVSMNPEPIQRDLARIPPADPLEEQLRRAARILLERSERIAALVGMLRMASEPTMGPPSGARQYIIESNAAILTAMIELFERHRDRLTVEPSRAAVAFRGAVFASGHPLIPTDEKRRPTPSIVS